MKMLFKFAALPSAFVVALKVTYDSFDPSLHDGAAGFLAGAVCTLLVVVSALVTLRRSRFDSLE